MDSQRREPELPTYPVSELLRLYKGEITEHPAERYALAFDGFEHQSTRLVGFDDRTVTFQLPGKRLLKVTPSRLGDMLGQRPFDMPVLERGTRAAGFGLELYYFIQPNSEGPASYAQVRAFREELRRLGYYLTEGDAEKLGLHGGGVRLLDPFAVQKLD
jgi:hypothetical protein